MAEETVIGGAAREFPVTRWTLIVSSRNGTEARQAALGELLSAYWKPLYYYVRRKGRTVEASKDVIQGFFLHLLERDFLSRLDPRRGRFRGYLKTAVDHYLVNLHEGESALKRGGSARTVSLDFDLAERGLAGCPEAPEAAYDREWAAGVMERTVRLLRNEFQAGDRCGPIDLALRFFQPGDPPSYAAAAADSGMSPSQFKAFLHRTRHRFRELLRQMVADTVAEGGETDSEIAHLLKALAG